jgi:heme-degrading monooxygenase HmoA
VIAEHAWLTITAGREDEFFDAVTSVLAVIESAPGCHGAEIRRQIENPSIFLLMVRWDSVDAHMAFRASADFDVWRAHTAPYYEAPSQVTHFSEVLSQ